MSEESSDLKILKHKTKRDIIRFNGPIPRAICLDHVINISLDGVRINFEFYYTQTYVDCDTIEAASTLYSQILNMWAGGS